MKKEKCDYDHLGPLLEEIFRELIESDNPWSWFWGGYTFCDFHLWRDERTDTKFIKSSVQAFKAKLVELLERLKWGLAQKGVRYPDQLDRQRTCYEIIVVGLKKSWEYALAHNY
jgi:hypothetical protein